MSDGSPQPVGENHRFYLNLRRSVPDGDKIEQIHARWSSQFAKLEKQKNAFRTQLNKNVDEFNVSVGGARKEFKERGPFGADDLSIDGAAELIAEFRQQCADQRQTVVT